MGKFLMQVGRYCVVASYEFCGFHMSDLKPRKRVFARSNLLVRNLPIHVAAKQTSSEKLRL